MGVAEYLLSARPPSLRARLRKRSHDARDASSSSSERGPRSITGRVICWTDVRNVELPFKLPFPILIGRIPSIAPSRPRGSCDSTDRRRDQRDSFLQYIFRMYAKYILHRNRENLSSEKLVDFGRNVRHEKYFGIRWRSNIRFFLEASTFSPMAF